jgi:hypothetical protein
VAYTGIDWSIEFPNALKMGQEGKTLNQIGEHYGVSRQRIKQVFNKYGVDPYSVGKALTSSQKKAQRQVAYLAKWGTKEDTDLYREQRAKFYAKKANATRIGWEWDIQFGDVVWPTHCPILGIELDYFAEYRKEESPSFDRMDTSKGYVKGNVVILSWRANRIKNDGTAEEHRRIAEYLDTLK